jgi:hypothetical protein
VEAGYTLSLEATMAEGVRQCRRCGAEIPAARIAAIPDTLVCVKCSEKMGGEHELEVTIAGTGKAGSLKKTGETVSVRRIRKPLQKGPAGRA